MKTRIISAAIAISFAVALLVVGFYFPIIIDIALALIAAMCVYEGLNARKLAKILEISIPCILFSFAFCMVYTLNLYPIAVFLFFLAMFVAMIFNHNKLTFNEFAYAIVITILCTLGFWSVEFMFDRAQTTMTGLFYVVTALTTPWLADGAAYFGGSLMGKRKLCPNISPKKTVEGAICGVVFGAVLSLLIGVVFTQFFFKNNENINYVILGIYGLLGAVISIVGDLSFSLIKRSAGIKDFGKILPGHGGILDRFDSVIFSAPLLLIFDLFLPIVIL